MNDIYKELQIIAAIGKAIWYYQNKKKYRDYVLGDYFKTRKTADPPDITEENPGSELIDENIWSGKGEGGR